jgi:hypothetical protein
MSWFRRAPSGPTGPFGDGERVTVAGQAVAVAPPIEAPLSGKPCVFWSTRIGIRNDAAPRDPRWLALQLGVVLPAGDAIARSVDPMRRSDGKMSWAGKQQQTRFALATKRGRLEVAEDELAGFDGSPLVIIPRDLAREHALVAAWGLAGLLPRSGMSHVVFEEVLVEVGQTVDAAGIVRHDGEAMQLENVRLKTRR